MEMKHFDTEFVIRRYWPYVRPDYFNRTTLFLDDKIVWPLEGGQEPTIMPEWGMRFRLEIPSGVLRGVFQGITVISDILEAWWIVECEWSGKFSGLANGSSSIGNFRYFTRPETIVRSNITADDLSYGEYIAIRRMVEAVTCGGLDQEAIRLWPEDNWTLMKTALGYLKTLRKEAERLAKTE